ncbi:MAG: hypothetical protein ACRCXC_01415 [Legionella sp.]
MFAAIDDGDGELAFECFNQLPDTDEILKALLAVHSAEYLQQIIHYCIQAQYKGVKKLNADLVITP